MNCECKADSRATSAGSHAYRDSVAGPRTWSSTGPISMKIHCNIRHVGESEPEVQVKTEDIVSIFPRFPKAVIWAKIAGNPGYGIRCANGSAGPRRPLARSIGGR